MTVLVLLAVSCGGGGTNVQPNPQDDTPAPGTADLNGQLVQAGTGKIVSTEGDGLPEVYVALIDTLTGSTVASDITDSLGKFKFKGVPAGDNYLVMIRFQSSEDLDGDGELDEIKLHFPVDLTDQAVVDMLQEIGAVDADGDGQLDAVDVKIKIQDNKGQNKSEFSRHNRQQGQSRYDDNGNGSFDDEDPVDDEDGDGLPDSPGMPDEDQNGTLFELKIRGPIQELSADSITVGGITLAINESTEFKRNGKNRGWDAFEVGDMVKVDAISDGEGGWVALEVKATAWSAGKGKDKDKEDGTTEISGIIEELTETTIVVGGVTFAHDEDTEWKLNDMDVEWDDFAVGMFVTVKGITDGEGGWIAREVEGEDEAPEEITVTGAIEALSDTSITVDGTTFALNAETDWKIDGEDATPGEFSIGMIVTVEGHSDGAGGWIAHLVEFESEEPEEITVSGLIEELTESLITVDGVSFAIDGETSWKYDGEDANPDQFEVGMFVTVHGNSDGMGGWIADEIEFESEESITVNGAIEILTETEITVDGTTFALNAESAWFYDGAESNPDMFEVGMVVTVEGHTDGTGGWIADIIDFVTPEPEELQVTGLIEVIAAGTITVDGVQFATNLDTDWQIDGSAALEGDFAVGMYVIVEGHADGMGGWIAHSIESFTEASGELTVTGEITAIDLGSISVSGYDFAIDLDTDFLINGLPALPAEFVVGMMVEVTGVSDGLGGWIARTIQNEDGDDVVLRLSGIFGNLTATTFTVGDVTIMFDVLTNWMIDGEAAAAADFEDGMFVTAEAYSDGSGGWIANLVEFDSISE